MAPFAVRDPEDPAEHARCATSAPSAHSGAPLLPWGISPVGAASNARAGEIGIKEPPVRLSMNHRDRKRALLAGVALWSAIAAFGGSLGGSSARGEDAETAVANGEAAALPPIAPSPPQQIARAELSPAAPFLGGLPLRRLDVLMRDPLLEIAERAAPAPRTGLEWREWQRPDGSQSEPSSLDRLVTPNASTEVSPALITFESERQQLLCTLRPDRLPDGSCHPDFFRMRPRPVDPRRAALFALGEHYFYRELRRFFRSDLKDRFKDDPSLSQDDYQARRDLIGQLGRGGRPEDLIIEEQTAEIRNEYIGDSVEDPEKELPVLQWGPLVIDDRGGMNIDVTRLSDERPLDRHEIELAPGEGAYGQRLGGSVLFPDDKYRVKSKVKFNPDLREVGRDWEQALGKLSASVQIDWRAPVLEHRSFSTEIGGSIDADGRYGLYLNLVIYGK